MRQVLFICTGNYYRSRFAEALFNTTALALRLPWCATSRGTDIRGAGRWNEGPISIYARQALEARGITFGSDPRMPAQLVTQDFARADLVVAVCEPEHRPHLERDFPAQAASVEYWSVQDLAVTPAEDALTALERHVLALVTRLAGSCCD